MSIVRVLVKKFVIRVIILYRSGGKDVENVSGNMKGFNPICGWKMGVEKKHMNGIIDGAQLSH